MCSKPLARVSAHPTWSGTTSASLLAKTSSTSHSRCGSSSTCTAAHARRASSPATRNSALTGAGARDSAVFEVREALREPGCAVCRLTLRSVGRLIKSVAYEQVNDPPLRKELRLAHGFCNPHAHRWLREARNTLGTAIIYRDVISAALRDFDAQPTGGILRALRGADKRDVSRACPACRVQSEAEGRYVDALLAVVSSNDDARAAFDRSDGVCRRHTLAALRRDSPGLEHVIKHTRGKMSELLQHLDEVIRKEDYRFRHEPRTDDERAAPGRAVAWTAGIDGLVDL